MPSITRPRDPDGDGASFSCRWRLEGRAAASVQVSGELDMVTAPELEQALDEAFAYARLVLVDVHELSFVDSSGLHGILNAARRVRAEGGRMLLTGAPRQLETLLKVTGTRAHVDVLRLDAETDGARAPHHRPGPSPPDRSRSSAENSIRPLDNPVNASVETARVMAFPDEQFWIQTDGSAIHRPWAPVANGSPLPIGTAIEVYLDASGAMNGWRDPRSGLAINQRRLERDEQPTTASDLACHGPCGVVWRAPAGDRLAEHKERCLTCAGPLVLS